MRGARRRAPLRVGLRRHGRCRGHGGRRRARAGEQEAAAGAWRDQAAIPVARRPPRAREAGIVKLLLLFHVGVIGRLDAIGAMPRRSRTRRCGRRERDPASRGASRESEVSTRIASSTWASWRPAVESIVETRSTNSARRSAHSSPSTSSSSSSATHRRAGCFSR